MPTQIDPLPPGLEGQGYAAGATNLRPGLPIQPVVGAINPVTQASTFSPMDLVARARNRFLSMFQSQPLPLIPTPTRTAQLEGQLNSLERRSTVPSVQDLRLQTALANAR